MAEFGGGVAALHHDHGRQVDVRQPLAEGREVDALELEVRDRILDERVDAERHHQAGRIGVGQPGDGLLESGELGGRVVALYDTASWRAVKQLDVGTRPVRQVRFIAGTLYFMKTGFP